MNESKKKALLRIGVIAMLVVLVLSFVVAPVFASTPTPTSTSTPTSKPNPTPPAVTGGDAYITGYTVLDAGGNEIQHVKPGQKCTIVVAINDSRITNAVYGGNGKPLPTPNIKITSTVSYTSPSLGDITTTTINNGTTSQLTAEGLQYGIILNDIVYNGGDNKLSFDLSYSDNARALTTLSQAISQCSAETPETSGPPSALIIKSASYGSNEVQAGTEFTLTATIFAAGGSAGVKNAAVNITLPEQITVVSGSTNYFVGDLKADQSKEVSFKLVASAVANPGSYNVSIAANGTSGKDNAPVTATMPVTIPVSQPERFEISRTNIPEYMAVGEEGYASISLVNKGKGIIYNVSAEIVGDGITTPEGKLFIGNIAPGTENNSDITLNVTKAGQIKAQVKITYEDAKATEKTITKDINITAEDQSMGGGDIGMMPDIGAIAPMEPQKSGIPWWVILIIVVVVVGAAVAVVIVLKKKKAKKIAEQLLEDEDEDI